jgi:hypothetical protein
VYVVRVDRERLDSTRDAMRLFHAFSLVRGAEGLPQEGTEYLPGALTRSRLAALPQSTRTLVLEDLTKVFLTWREWKSAAARLDIRFQRRLELRFFCVILHDVSRSEFERGLEPELIAQMLYNPYEVACV